jgi:twitching motility protein PilI
MPEDSSLELTNVELLQDPFAALNRFLPNVDEEPGPTRVPRIGSVRYGFKVGKMRLLIPSHRVSEVIDTSPIYTLPNSEDWLLGMINLRGNLVPIFDLHRVFGEEPNPETESRLLTIDKGSEAVGMRIDGTPQAVDTLIRAEGLPQLPKVLEGVCGHAYIDGDETWAEFDAETFFWSVSGCDRPSGDEK